MSKIRIITVVMVLAGIALHGQERKLLWEDDFDGNELNAEFWNFELGDGCPDRCGWGNN
jgi:hypothetical protein